MGDDAYLSRCKSIASLYLDALQQYQRQFQVDPGLSESAQTRMQPVLAELAKRISTFLDLVPASDSHREALRTEFAAIERLFARLADTTLQLRELGRRVGGQISLIPVGAAERQSLEKPELEDDVDEKAQKEDDANWLENVSANVSRQDETLRKFQQRFVSKKPALNTNLHPEMRAGDKSKAATTKKKRTKSSVQTGAENKYLLTPEDMTNYLSGFKMIQEEFGSLKEEIRQLKAAQRSHTHSGIDRKLQRMNTIGIRVGTNDRTIQQEHSDLLLGIRVLSKIAV